jgi:hypothetical protein
MRYKRAIKKLLGPELAEEFTRPTTLEREIEAIEKIARDVLDTISDARARRRIQRALDRLAKLKSKGGE